MIANQKCRLTFQRCRRNDSFLTSDLTTWREYQFVFILILSGCVYIFFYSPSTLGKINGEHHCRAKWEFQVIFSARITPIRTYIHMYIYIVYTVRRHSPRRNNTITFCTGVCKTQISNGYRLLTVHSFMRPSVGIKLYNILILRLRRLENFDGVRGERPFIRIVVDVLV